MILAASDIKIVFLGKGRKVFYFEMKTNQEGMPVGNCTLNIFPAYESSILEKFILENVSSNNSLIGEIEVFRPNGYEDEDTKKFWGQGFGSDMFNLMYNKCKRQGVEMIIAETKKKNCIDFLKRRNFYFVNDYGRKVGYKFLR